MSKQLSKNFASFEMRCRGCIDTELCPANVTPPMDLNFIMMLQELRNRCGFAIAINSGWRCPYWNAHKSVKGAPNSWHLHGLAVDIRCENDERRIIIVKHAIDIGFKDISVAKSFIHLDNGHRSKQQMRVY